MKKEKCSSSLKVFGHSYAGLMNSISPISVLYQEIWIKIHLFQARTFFGFVTTRKKIEARKQVTCKYVRSMKKIEFSENVITIFLTVLFADECCATLDGPDRWSKRLGSYLRKLLSRQEAGDGGMFWDRIIGGEMVGPWWLPDVVKMTSQIYCVIKKYQN